jgi:glycosyltransferase involved in cell wall biosynthesis
MEKGLDVFAAVHDELTRRDVAHRVLVIGEGPARPWFEKALPGGIFVGHQEGADLARALASADLFLNPSITETFGNVTLEAMACALPVVAVSATGATNLVHDGQTGTLAEPGDICALAEAINAYAADPDLRRRHGSAGLAFAETQDWDVINASVLKTYTRAIERRERLTRIKG